MAWTQGAMEDHSHWFPCFDSPNNLATYRIAVRHRAGFIAAANGEPTGRVEHGDGWATTGFAQRKPHVLYLVNLAVGDFVAVDDVSGPVPITHYLPRGHEAGAPAMFRATAFAIRWLGEFIGVPFAWARYGHVVVHGFMWGGMENTTLTTITDRGLMDAGVQRAEDVDIDSLVIHELVHQWFGDLLTMKAWSDIWLNESFATYLEARCTAAWRSAQGQGTVEDILALELWGNRQAYFDEDRGRYRRPLVTNRYVDPYELFDRVAYEKGSLVLHALCRQLGEERFRAALALYTRRHAHDLVETADFRQALEDATGEPLDWFFDQWVLRAGHPRLKVAWRHDPRRGQLLVDVEQQQAAGDDQQAFRLRVDLAWGAAGGGVERQRVELLRAKETLVIACARAPRWVALDPDGDLPAEWDEDGETEQLLARLGDAGLGAQARARAAAVAGGRHPAPRLVAGLAAALADAATPELVRTEVIAALGRLRGPAARDALLAAWPGTAAPRLRRALAAALAGFKRDASLAERLAALAATEPSLATAAELYAARGALEHPGATPLLRAQLKRPSWNQRLRQGVLRGLGESGEPAAIDEVLAVLADDLQIDGVRSAALAAAAQLGARFLPARERVRQAIEPLLETGSLMVRSAAARALGRLGDPAAAAALAACHQRELFGNVRRVLREAQEQLGKAAATVTATAQLAKQVEELERAKRALELRLEAVEKRLGEPRPAPGKPRRKRPGR
jgi:aminopeptidase N